MIKSAFNPCEKGEFLEVLKDIVAMANSGGGIILVSVQNDGQPSAVEFTGLAALDPAKIVDAIYKYSDCQFNGFELRAVSQTGHAVWAIGVGPTNIPLVFSQTGNYAEPGSSETLSSAALYISVTARRASRVIRKTRARSLKDGLNLSVATG